MCSAYVWFRNCFFRFCSNLRVWHSFPYFSIFHFKRIPSFWCRFVHSVVKKHVSFHSSSVSMFFACSSYAARMCHSKPYFTNILTFVLLHINCMADSQPDCKKRINISNKNAKIRSNCCRTFVFAQVLQFIVDKLMGRKN